ncbi:hypothetical protein BDP55DRAFT_672190 [Colletotrichum godetiae]|uniref:Uncharacterized protein n=1 Tax=Colletotrichum godetiae TaxID=1209918 RepID=A0AAJ0EUX4_9PEZI|nr:uncharacterized protein BDP55DRAFT_672190 [Colletotrichum godetiae]KAK1672654.1 hypothetical protein BDP55DRAFT_672190 [Colletotrichum godetiae]
MILTPDKPWRPSNNSKPEALRHSTTTATTSRVPKSPLPSHPDEKHDLQRRPSTPVRSPHVHHGIDVLDFRVPEMQKPQAAKADTRNHLRFSESETKSPIPRPCLGFVPTWPCSRSPNPSLPPPLCL